MFKKFLYRKFSRGYPVMPINLALPDCWTFLNAGRVSLIMMSRFGANSISWTCEVKKKKEILWLHQLIKVAYKRGVQVKCLIDKLINWLIDWLIDWLFDWLIDWLTDRSIDWCLTPYRQYISHFNGGRKKGRRLHLASTVAYDDRQMVSFHYLVFPSSNIYPIIMSSFYKQKPSIHIKLRVISKKENYVKFW